MASASLLDMSLDEIVAKNRASSASSASSSSRKKENVKSSSHDDSNQGSGGAYRSRYNDRSDRERLREKAGEKSSPSSSSPVGGRRRYNDDSHGHYYDQNPKQVKRFNESFKGIRPVSAGSRRGQNAAFNSSNGAKASLPFSSSARQTRAGDGSWRRNYDREWQSNSRRSDAIFPDFSTRKSKNNFFQRGNSNNTPTPDENVVIASNLDYSIMEADLKELFSSVGEVVKVWVDYDKIDRSEGSGGCIFRLAEDAIRAVQRFDSRKIEGQPIRLQLRSDLKNRSRLRPASNAPYGGVGNAGGAQMYGGGGGGDFTMSPILPEKCPW